MAEAQQAQAAREPTEWELYESPTQLDSDPWTIPLEDIDMSQGYLFKAQKHYEYFKRLRQEDPVHYHDQHPIIGPFWSITR